MSCRSGLTRQYDTRQTGQDQLDVDSQRHNSLERGTTLVREKKTEASLPTHNNSAIYALLDKDESSTNMLVYITATTTLVNNRVVHICAPALRVQHLNSLRPA
ncbi:hypothetical protein G6O67_000576 [Ophiocordyceps sinensis]|uniref:Uncharacterized protein n=1 Tax=Ophiocordyceps sinensis TaxID=72228 RepID=A0A8H4V9S9_9HYPO|nr:hypothetical protein G6O67_000576 [Ophiocordyceps sinensis]